MIAFQIDLAACGIASAATYRREIQMLNRLRKGAGGWLAQLFIALLVVSFAVWGVSDIFTGFRGDAVATVGDTDVSTQQFYRQYETAKQQLGQQLGQPITDEQARLFGLPGQVLGRLITEATLTDQAKSLGLGVSGDTLARQIADDPTFQGASGTFDRNRFIQIINANNMTEDDFIEELRTRYVRQQLASALVGGLNLPDAYMRPIHEYQSEERSIDYLVLTPSMAGEVGEPSETQLTTFFNDHKDDWRAPEQRSVRVMTMTPADLADTGDISDEEARRVYDTQVATRFTTPERRKVEQIVFKDSATAAEAASALADGKTFDELVIEQGLKPEDVELGLVTMDELLDPVVAEAAFGLGPDSVSGIVEGRFGPVILRVTTIEPEVVQSFESVVEQIKQELAEAKAVQEIADQLDVIEDARAGGSTLDEIASNYGLSIRTFPAIDATGKDGDGETIPDLPAGQDLVNAAFESDVGLENNPLPLEQGYVWYEVTAVAAERDRELAEVRERVIAAYEAAEVASRLDDMAEAIRQRLSTGETIADVAGEENLTAETATAIKRNTPPTEALSAAAIQAAFGGPEGHAAVAAGIEDAKIVLIVTDVTVPPYFSGAPDLTQVEERLSSEIGNDFLGQYVAQLQDRLGVAVNQVALQQVIGLAEPGT